MILIKNARVFSPKALGKKDVLIAFDKILEVADCIEPWRGDLTVIDAAGKMLVPGFIDQHVHIVGGGGEGGFNTRTPEFQLSKAVTSGVTTLDYGTFKAVAVAAKDCAGPSASVIEGTDGYILQATPPNACGSVELHLNDGTFETYDENPELQWESEFRAFAADADGGDEGLAHCYRMLEQSLLVSRVQTEARLGAGVRFPADEA